MLSHLRGVRSRTRCSRNIIRDIDKALPSTSSAIDKIKCAKNELKNKKNEESAVIKKAAKVIKVEEKLVMNKRETSKKDVKKKDYIANSISLNKLPVKRDPEITETIDPLRNSKRKKQIKETLMKDIKEEINSDAVDDDQIIEDKKLENKIHRRNLFRKSTRNITKKEKVVKGNSANTRLPGSTGSTERKKKDDKEDKAFSNNLILTPVNIENVPFDKDTPVVVGDNLVVYYGVKDVTTYDAKVISVCKIEGVMKYYIHYKGWNSRYDEWIDAMRIAYKTKDLEPRPEVHNADSSKSSPPEQKNEDLKKALSTKDSATPLTHNSNVVKKSPFSCVRPIRTCTLTNLPLYNIDNFDSDEECAVSVESSTLYSKRQLIKTELYDISDLKTTLYPKSVNTESVILDQQIEIEVPKINQPVTDDVYRFKESESSNFGTISSVAEEKLCRSIRHDSLKLYNSKKPDELQRIIDSPAQEEVVDQNRLTMIQFVPNSNIIYSFDNNIKIEINDNLNNINEIENPITLNQSDYESNEFQNLKIREVTVDKPYIKEIEQHFQDEVNVSDFQYEVLDLCMKPPQTPLPNIFSIPKHYELNDMIVEEDDQTDTNSDAKYSSFKASQAVKNVIFDTNFPGKSSLFDPNIPSCSTKNFYDHNIPSTSKCNFYENSLSSTSKSFYNSEYNVNSVLICEETIPGSPTGMSEEQYDQEEGKKTFEELYEKREAAHTMSAMKHSFCRPTITLMGATEEKMKEYPNILQKDDPILHQHLLFLADIASRNLDRNINEPSVAEPHEREPETTVEKIAKPPVKLQFKRKISSQEQTPKRSKLSTTTAPVASVSHVEKPDEDEDEDDEIVKYLSSTPVYPPDMESAQKQAVQMARIDGIRTVLGKLKIV